MSDETANSSDELSYAATDPAHAKVMENSAFAGVSAAQKSSVAAVTLAALGVVYGDIGASPLYALRECFHGPFAMPVSHANVMGVLSLIFWALVLIISVKYLALVMRADNDGEGGIIALMVLARRQLEENRMRWLVLMLGLFGAGLLYGDGMITPAISVLSAVEGLKVVTPALERFVIPVTVLILMGLFMLQKRGTAHVGRLFGPVMILWFTTLCILGCNAILSQPHVLAAMSPHFAVDFFVRNQVGGFLILGVVFLVVTGGEALYADMGHFGARPIRLAWFAFVLPSLVINYFGQGALLLSDPSAAESPFYHLAPDWAKYPLVLLATLATVIASQAVITGAFSLAYQAAQLGLMPRMTIIHTTAAERGQVYVPAGNSVLLFAVVSLVLLFKSSSNLAAAYGMAVTLTMVITALLLYIVARKQWVWSRLLAGSVVGLFLLVDLAFLAANSVKFLAGGWLPLLIGIGVCVLTTTWKRGRELVAEILQPQLAEGNLMFSAQLEADPPNRVATPAIYLTPNTSGIPLALVHNLEHNRALHQSVGILSVVTEPKPYVPLSERLDVNKLGQDMHRIVAHYGFKQTPNVPNALQQCREHDVDFTGPDTTFFLGRISLDVDGKKQMSRWRKQLFAWMAKNERDASKYYGIPSGQVVEIGSRLEL